MSTLPPGPKLAKAVQTIAMWGYWDRYLEACRRRYGDVFTVRAAPMGTLVYFADPAAIKEVFTGDAQTLHAGEGQSEHGQQDPLLTAHLLPLVVEDGEIVVSPDPRRTVRSLQAVETEG